MPRKRAHPRRSPGEIAAITAGTERFETVGDWLRFAVTSFSRSRLAFVQGFHGAHEEALFLVSQYLGLEQDDLPHFLNARLTADESRAIADLIARRVNDRFPLAYLVKEGSLGGHRFYVDPRVLIPRSYIAELIPDGIRRFAGASWRPQRILDLGTGCGCLAILAAHAFAQAVVDAVDDSKDALDVAEINVQSHRLDERVHLLRSNLFSALPDEKYDLILANPPYEPSGILSDQPSEIGHEPPGALDGGADGMRYVRSIIRNAGPHLKPGGVLILELGELRPTLTAEFPRLRHTVMPLADGSEAVLGFKAEHLAAAARRR